jgi:hypothetical protein
METNRPKAQYHADCLTDRLTGRSEKGDPATTPATAARVDRDAYAQAQVKLRPWPKGRPVTWTTESRLPVAAGSQERPAPPRRRARSARASEATARAQERACAELMLRVRSDIRAMRSRKQPHWP